MLDLVKEPLDAIACAIEVSTEVDGLSAIAFRGDVGPRSLLVDKCPGFRGNDTQAIDALEDEQCIRRARSSLRAQPICHHLYCLHADPVSARGSYLQSGRTFQDNARGPRARLLKCDRQEKDHVVGHKLGHIFFFIAAMASTMEKFPLAG